MSRGRGKQTGNKTGSSKAAGAKATPRTKVATKDNPQQEWMSNLHSEIALTQLQVDAMQMIEHSFERDLINNTPIADALATCKRTCEAALGQIYQRNSPMMMGQEFDTQAADEKAVDLYLAKLQEYNDRSYYIKPEAKAGWLSFSSSNFAVKVQKRLNEQKMADDFEFDSQVYQAIDAAEKYIEYTAARIQAFQFATSEMSRGHYKQHDENATRIIHRELYNDHDKAWRNLLLFASIVDDEEMRKELTAKVAEHYLSGENRSLAYFLSPVGRHMSYENDDKLKDEVNQAIDDLKK